MYLPLFVGALCFSLFWYAFLCVLSSCAIILTRMKELVALLLLSFGHLVAELPCGAVGWSIVCDCGIP